MDTNLSRILREVAGEVRGEVRHEPAVAARSFGEVGGGEPPQLHELEDVVVDDGSDWFHEVEREAVAVLLIGVDDAEPRVEAEGLEREDGFGLEKRVPVVK